MGTSQQDRRPRYRHVYLTALVTTTVLGGAVWVPVRAQTAAPGRARARAANAPASRAATAPATAPTTRAAEEEETVDSLLVLGQQAVDSQKYDVAQGYYRRVLEKEPNNLLALGGMALTSLKQNKPTDSLQYYVKAAGVAIATGRYTDAEQLAQRAGAIDPNAPPVFRLLGQVYAADKDGRRDALAIDMYRTYLKMEPNDAVAYLDLGQLYLRTHNYRQAIAALEDARALNRQDIATLAALANAYRAAVLVQPSVADRENARKAAQQAIDMLEGRLGSRDLTNVPSEILSGIPQNVADYYGIYAATLLDADNAEEAERQASRGIDVVRRRLQQAPDDQVLLGGLAQLYNALGEILKKRLAAKPQDVALLTRRARLMEDVADLNRVIQMRRAVEVWTEAAKYAPKDRDILYGLATAQHRIKKNEDAAETCRKILAIQPNDAMAQDLLRQIGPVATRPAPATGPASATPPAARP
jgi:tetratricopeptide (TPR) repeat protein